MREKIINLMKSEGLSPSRFAEMLEVQPSGISHIVSGRNKPGFDLLQKILRRFPNVNPDWLLLDSPEMYRANVTHESPTPPVVKVSAGLFDNIDEPVSKPVVNSSLHNAQNYGTLAEAMNKPGVKVEKIVIFYSDKTFECYES